MRILLLRRRRPRLYDTSLRRRHLCTERVRRIIWTMGAEDMYPPLWRDWSFTRDIITASMIFLIIIIRTTATAVVAGTTIWMRPYQPWPSNPWIQRTLGGHCIMYYNLDVSRYGGNHIIRRQWRRQRQL